MSREYCPERAIAAAQRVVKNVGGTVPAESLEILALQKSIQAVIKRTRSLEQLVAATRPYPALGLLVGSIDMRDPLLRSQQGNGYRHA